MIEEKIQRKFIEIGDLHNADDSDYWRDISPIERIEAIEFMRKVMFGYDRVSERLQGVLTVAELKENFISKKDLLTNKRASGRPKDLADYDKLKDE